MTAASDSGKTVVLSGEEVTYLRNVLVACSQALTRAQRDTGPASALLAEATRAAAGGRSVSGLIYDVSLAIDYLDFAPPARSWR